MMKKLLTILLCLSMIFVFSACGSDGEGDQAGDDNPTWADDGTPETVDFDLEGMYAANQASVLLGKYGSIGSTMEYIDPGETEPFKTVYNVIEAAGGEYKGYQKETLGEKLSYYNWEKNDEGTGVEYVSDKGVLASFIFPDDDYEWGVTSQWDARYYYSPAYEVATGFEENDDEVIVKAHYDSYDDGKIYDSVYHLAKDSYEITAMERTYFKVSGEESFTIFTVNTFGEDGEAGTEAYDDCLKGDKCEYTITMILDAAKTKIEEHSFTISQDCPVYFTSRGGSFDFFDSEEMKHDVSRIDPAGKKVHYWAVSTDETHDEYAEGLDKALTSGLS